METLGALAIIAAIVTLVAWMLVRRPRDGDTATPPKPPSEPPSELTIAEQVRRIARDTIKVEFTDASTSRRHRDETYPTQVVGESHYQHEIRSIAEAHPDRGPLDESAECVVRALLIPETNNPYDVNAVRVEVDGRQIGSLSREDAARYRSLVGLGQAPVAATIVGGWDRGQDDRGFYGVRLAFTMEGSVALPRGAELPPPAPLAAPTPLGALAPRDDSAFPVDVMGEVRYQHALERVCGERMQDGAVLVVPAKCVPESRDDEDFRVRVEIGGATVGYLSSEPAWTYMMTMDGASSECRARIYGGQDHGANTNAGFYGVRLDLVLRDVPPEIAPHQRARDYPCEIMGESSHQQELRSIIQRRKTTKPTAWVPLVMARLEPDSSTPLRVHVVIGGQGVGYLGRVNARKYLASPQALEVPACITASQGSDGRTRFGVRLTLNVAD